MCLSAGNSDRHWFVRWVPSAYANGPSGLAVVPRLIEKELRVQVFVRDNNVDQALKALKKKMQREGIFRDLFFLRHFDCACHEIPQSTLSPRMILSR